MAKVPDAVFTNIDAEIDEGDRFNLRHDRLTKMAIIAIREACNQIAAEQPFPVVLGMSDRSIDKEGLSSLIENLQENCKPWISAKLSRSLNSGRAAGIEAIDFTFRYLYDEAYPFVLVGSSDCYMDEGLLSSLEDEQRLLTQRSSDAFAPGEAASFLLLTRHLELAENRNGFAIALHPPGISKEEGHLYSDSPYRGEGLDHAFKGGLLSQPVKSIHGIYSSMNGENHWAKEYGVAYLRNKDKFVEKVDIAHPADCFGDLGAATATSLITLAAEHLHKNNNVQRHLVYSSSDFGARGAIVVEKVRLENETELKV